MLVLSRSEDESIEIGNDITITVLEMRGGKVRIGIDAPPDVRVLRSELAMAIEERVSIERSQKRLAAELSRTTRRRAVRHGR